LPFCGNALQGELMALDVRAPMLRAVAEDRLDTKTVANMMRARRDHPAYLRRVLAQLDVDQRPYLARMLCQNVVSRMHAPRFRRRLAELEAQLDPQRRQNG